MLERSTRQGKERRGVHEPEVQEGWEVVAAGGGAGPLQPTTLRGWTSLADSQKHPTLEAKIEMIVTTQPAELAYRGTGTSRSSCPDT